jgi:hypothetical protein
MKHHGTFGTLLPQKTPKITPKRRFLYRFQSAFWPKKGHFNPKNDSKTPFFAHFSLIFNQKSTVFIAVRAGKRTNSSQNCFRLKHFLLLTI